METNPAVEQNKNGPSVRRISPVGKEKVYGWSNVHCNAMYRRARIAETAQRRRMMSTTGKKIFTTAANLK